MQKNTVRLSGYIYNPKETTTASGKVITRFGMKIYSGKDSSGKAKYDFINCKLFDRLESKTGEFDVLGRLAVESWEKDGIKHKDVVVMAEKVYPVGSEKTEQTKQEQFNDDIPW